MIRVRLPLPRFLSAGEMFAGRGSIAALKGLEAARAAVLMSESIWRDERLRTRIAAAVGAHDTAIVRAPSGEPELSKLGSALQAIASFRPDWIVAVGGGSVLDAGKLAWICYEQPDADIARYVRPFALPALRGKCRFVAVPTTAGTGSEVSSSTVFTDTTGRKQAIVSHELLPDVAILDPDLTIGVPASVVANAGLDALSHAVEGHVSRFDNPFADTFAENAVRTLIAKLPQTVRDPADLETRLQVMQAATYAGWVQNLKVPGIGHGVAHQLGRFEIPHGAACGALLIPSIQFNAADPAVARRYSRLAEAIGVRDVDGLIAAIADLRTALRAPALKDIAVGGVQTVRGLLPVIVEGALADVCSRANPRAVDAAAVETVLEGALMA